MTSSTSFNTEVLPFFYLSSKRSHLPSYEVQIIPNHMHVNSYDFLDCK
jgi:hypothetical protein